MTWRIAPLSAIGLSLILLLNAWLLNEVVAELLSDGLPSADKVDWNFGRSTASGNVANRKPIEAYAQILTRPVFFKSREPFVPAPPQPSKAAAAPVATDPGLILGGVMIKDGVRKAYVVNRANAEGAWISERDKFMGWEIRSISKSGARLEQQGRSLDLQLYPE